MRVIVLGGTRFIGRAIVDALVAAGHDPLVCHRGLSEPEDLPAVAHLHSTREQLGEHRERLEAFRADAVVDCFAMSASEASAALEALPSPSLHRVVLSSQDVYQAFATVQSNELATDTVPITEDAPLRADRYPSRNEAGQESYSKIDVEEVALGAGATVLRLPMTYGPHDYVRREEFVLRRVRAGRPRIPVGAANALFPLALVDDVARGVVAAVDLGLTRAFSQALVFSSARARQQLGYCDTDADQAVAYSVRWHLAHPPDAISDDFTRDEEALAAAD
jgi:nucleoside-diphosphate-sugar epimerase